MNHITWVGELLLLLAYFGKKSPKL